MRISSPALDPSSFFSPRSLLHSFLSLDPPPLQYLYSRDRSFTSGIPFFTLAFARILSLPFPLPVKNFPNKLLKTRVSPPSSAEAVSADFPYLVRSFLFFPFLNYGYFFLPLIFSLFTDNFFDPAWLYFSGDLSSLLWS